MTAPPTHFLPARTRSHPVGSTRLSAEPSKSTALKFIEANAHCPAFFTDVYDAGQRRKTFVSEEGAFRPRSEPRKFDGSGRSCVVVIESQWLCLGCGIGSARRGAGMTTTFLVTITTAEELRLLEQEKPAGTQYAREAMAAVFDEFDHFRVHGLGVSLKAGQ